MVAYRLSPRAAADLDEIYEYGILNFGLDRAREYLGRLHDRFQLLGESPMFGRPAPELAELAPDLRRLEYGSHVIFYLPEQPKILIVRVLGAHMDHRRHL